MIEIISAVFMMFMFVVWTRKNWYNTILKTAFLACSILLAIDTAAEMGYVINASTEPDQ